MKSTIETKNGAIVTIEGAEDEVSALTAILAENSVSRPKKMNDGNGKAQKRPQPSNLVLELKEEGFFDEAKGLGDIAAALQTKGYIYPLTTLSGVMIGAVKKRLLGRKKIDGKWFYGK